MRAPKKRLAGWGMSLVLSFLMLPGLAQGVELKEAVEQLAAQLAKSVPEGRQFRIAVADFPDLQGMNSDLGRYIAERLTTRLAQTPKFRVIERRRLGQVLAELRFGMSDLVDPAKAKQLGRIAGVETLAVGSLSDLGNIVEVDARIIEVETSNMLVAATTTISKDDTVKAMLERGREMPASPGAGGPLGGGPPPVAMGTVKYQEFPKFRVEVEDLRPGPDQITAFLRYTNKTEDEISVAFDAWQGHQNTYLTDNEGNQYQFLQSTGMAGGWYVNHWSNPVFLNIPPKGSIPATITFKGSGRKPAKHTNFDLVSAQVLVDWLRRGDRRQPTVAGGISISIRRIEPR